MSFLASTEKNKVLFMAGEKTQYNHKYLDSKLRTALNCLLSFTKTNAGFLPAVTTFSRIRITVWTVYFIDTWLLLSFLQFSWVLIQWWQGVTRQTFIYLKAMRQSHMCIRPLAFIPSYAIYSFHYKMCFHICHFIWSFKHNETKEHSMLEDRSWEVQEGHCWIAG